MLFLFPGRVGGIPRRARSAAFRRGRNITVPGAETGKVLILSPHVMTAALVGWYVELASLEPAFAAPDEQPEEALTRVRPVLVVLVDAEVRTAFSDLFVARALKRQVGLAVFSGRPADDEARRWADCHGVPFFRLPIDLEAFGRLLDQAVFQVPNRRVRERRQPRTTDRALDGTLVFNDATGHSWYVYDRRRGDARAAEPFRSFVDAEGHERRCTMRGDDFADRTAPSLEAQLMQAQPIA
jgi:hypothetical protein